MPSKSGYYALARRDLDHGGESVEVVTELPVEWKEINSIAVERDRLELVGNPSSPIRYFPVELTGAEIAQLGLGRRMSWRVMLLCSAVAVAVFALAMVA